MDVGRLPGAGQVSRILTARPGEDEARIRQAAGWPGVWAAGWRRRYAPMMCRRPPRRSRDGLIRIGYAAIEILDPAGLARRAR
jgi:hypothetical protein